MGIRALITEEQVLLSVNQGNHHHGFNHLIEGLAQYVSEHSNKDLKFELV